MKRGIEAVASFPFVTFALIMALLASGCSAGVGAREPSHEQTTQRIDINAFTIEHVPIATAHDANGETRQWLSVVAFTGTIVRVPLVWSYENKHGIFGLEEKSVTMQWLDGGTLLWISWHSIPFATSRLTFECNIIMQITNGAAREVFRDHLLSHDVGRVPELVEIRVEKDTALSYLEA
jgi:hypothetical protein